MGANPLLSDFRLMQCADFEIHGRPELRVFRRLIVRRAGGVLAYLGSELPQALHRPDETSLFRGSVSTAEKPQLAPRQARGFIGCFAWHYFTPILVPSTVNLYSVASR